MPNKESERKKGKGRKSFSYLSTYRIEKSLVKKNEPLLFVVVVVVVSL